MRNISTYGWVWGLVCTLLCAGIYGYSVYLLTSLTSDALSPASVRSEIALSTNTKVFALARRTKEARTQMREFYITKEEVVRFFDYIEQVHKVSDVKIKVQSISESAEIKPARRSRSAEDGEEKAPKAENQQTPQVPTPKGLSSVTAQIEISGKKQKVLAALDALEHLPVMSIATNVSLRKKGSASESIDEWIANMSLTAPALPALPNDKK